MPCSATGVIRRHPDIKLLRRPDDVAALAAKQLELLNVLWALLAPGGGWSTQAARRCAPKLRPWSRHLWRPCGASHGPREGATRLPVRIAAGTAGMDGFYYACLEKTEGQ